MSVIRSVRAPLRGVSPRGAALIDVIFACGLVVVMCAVAVPIVQTTQEHDTPRLAARYLATRLQSLRIEAVRRNRVVALRFDPDVPGRLASYVDGDGDGVLERDIDAGIDPPLGIAFRLDDLFQTVTLRVAATVPSPDGSGTVLEGSDPVRIGRSNLVSLSPLGSATAGTIYLAGRAGSQFCVRIFGATGRVRVLWFDRTSGTWRQE
jgi:hypothetical protein